MKRNIEVIDLTLSSDDESEDAIVWSNLNELFVQEEVTFDVLPVEERVYVSSPIPKIPKIKEVRTDMTMDSSCVITPSVHAVRNTDVQQGVSIGCSPVFNPVPNRFYCYCNKTQTNHTHEKLLAMRGLAEDRRIYWTCRTRALSAISGCKFFTRDPVPPRTLD